MSIRFYLGREYLNVTNDDDEMFTETGLDASQLISRIQASIAENNSEIGFGPADLRIRWRL